MVKDKKYDQIDIAIVGSSVAFLISYLGISFFNRATQDDFFFYDRIRTMGIYNSVKDYYCHFEGAYSNFFWIHMIGYLNQYSTRIFLVNVFNLLLLSGSLILLISQILKYLQPNHRGKTPFYLCFLTIMSILHFQNDVIQQAVFWFTGSLAYMSTVSWLFFGIYFLLKRGSLNFIFSCIFFFLFSSSRLHYALIELGILFYFFMWYWMEYRKMDKRIIIVFIVTFIGLGIYLIAPGNYAGRFTGDEQAVFLNTSILTYLKAMVIALVYYFYVHILKILPLLLLVFSLSFILGLKQSQSAFSKNTLYSYLKFYGYTLAISWLFLAVVMVITQQGAGPSRTFFFSLFITVFLSNLLFYFLGVVLKDKVLVFSKLTLIFGFAASFYFVFFLVDDWKKLNEFSVQFDNRVEVIEKARDYLTSADTLHLPVLPNTNSFMNNETKGAVWLPWVKCQEDALKAFYRPAYQIKLVSTVQ